MPARPSILDLEIAWEAVDEVIRGGRGALDRVATRHAVGRAVVKEAVDRVEKSLGGRPFFVTRIRRSGTASDAGFAFHRTAPAAIAAWRAMEVAVAAAPMD